jgi:predicted nucleic acid-binding Zn ribbon protein
MEKIVSEKRYCIFCGKELKGRSDKKFCDDACRNNYGYQQNKHNNEVINKINKSLLYNRNVLKSITRSGKKIVKKQTLVNSNFNFDVMTGLYKTHKKHEYKLLYDYAYRCINDEDVLVFKYFE